MQCKEYKVLAEGKCKVCNYKQKETVRGGVDLITKMSILQIPGKRKLCVDQ